MDFWAKLQPVFIVFSAFAGIFIGKSFPGIEQNAGKSVEWFLVLMLFFVFLNVKMREIARSFSDLRFSASALLINFVFTPLYAFALSKVFFAGRIDLQIGFIMLLVTPCTDWYLVFTGTAHGNVPLGASILPLNLVLQILLLPVYLVVCMGTAVSFEISAIIRGIVFVLILPLGSATLVKLWGHTHKRKMYLDAVLKKADTVQFALLCLAILAMFASQGTLLLDNVAVFIQLLPPLALFFAVIFCVSFFTGKLLKLPFTNIIPLIFTTSARNSPVSLAIAAITFPVQPLVSLVLVMGPLIELPVLAVNSLLLRRIGRRPNA
ncbi:MAG: bile acid:sodium symporter [Spirochaetaceae bacterium]|jgi:ACR3 family arsenite efflux pump ArsB|nr:bile acid:sodium symporter [Spirochaetaceae bacterium]